MIVSPFFPSRQDAVTVDASGNVLKIIRNRTFILVFSTLRLASDTIMETSDIAFLNHN